MILRMLSYNIRYGGVGREEHLAAVIQGCAPDLVVLQEANRPDVVARLATTTSMRAWAALPGRSVAFMSRLEIAHHEWHRPAWSKHAFLEIVPAGTTFRIFGLHLSAVHSSWTERRRARELRALLKSIERHQQGFHVLAGDFNTLAPGELLDLQRLPRRLRALVWLGGGTIQWETIRIMLEASYVDGYRERHPLGDRGFTFPTWDPHVRLDYVFLPAPFADRLESCQVVNESAQVRLASDHFPLLAQLDVA